MEKLKRVLWLGISIVTIACSHTVKMIPEKEISFYERKSILLRHSSRTNINDIVKNKNVNVMMLNGLKFECKDLVITKNGTSWYNVSRQKKEIVSNSDIYGLKISSSSRGFWDGADLGLLFGLISGLSLLSDENTEPTLILAVPAVGYVIGGIFGAVIKGRYNFKFLDPVTGR